MNETTNLSVSLSNICKLQREDIEQLKLLIIDYFAAAYAGFKQNATFNRKVENVVYSQDKNQEAFVLFQTKKYSTRIAAFMNALYGHGAELDDGNKKAAGHIGVHVIPAVFALADKIGGANEDILIAIAVGYEAFIRIASAAMPEIVKRGFHTTGMAGTLACAAACAKLYKLNSLGIENAIALATTMSGGLLSYGDSRPAIKPLNPAKAAENGMFAAMLAKEGIQGPSEALEGTHGWFHAVADSYDINCLQGSNHLLLHDCYFKLYPSCRHTHCGIDAAISLHHKVHLNEIKSIRIYIYPNAIKLAGIAIPKNQDETKFSIHYTFATALINGCYGIADMDVSNISQDVLLLISKISLIADESMENIEKGVRGAKVEIEKGNGEILKESINVPKGDPENPLTKNDIITKLYSCAKGQTNEATIKKLIQAIDSIEGISPFQNPIKKLLTY